MIMNHEAAVLADVTTALLLSFLVLNCISLKSISFESMLLMDVLFIFLRLIVVPRDFTTANCIGNAKKKEVYCSKLIWFDKLK